MAKILVADDNSNVHKTVSLALVDLGVEIVSVNNGEAAVRKLVDFSPDLVLADIFMPVRNGYEVCEYIKKDARFAHVPVVLLVGAFDPFDEREAQRVGANGALKKPFVPPEPLITMVKTLLEHVMSNQPVGVSAGKSEVAVRAKTNALAPKQERSPETQMPDESPVQEFTPPVSRLTFEEGEHPIAFSQFLEMPVQDTIDPVAEVIEPVESDQVLTSPRDANLGDPIFWRDESPEPEPKAEPPEEISAEFKMRAWTQDAEPYPDLDEGADLQPIEPLELVREELEDTSHTIVEPKSIEIDPAVQTSLTVKPGRVPDLADTPLEWMATAPALNQVEETEVAPGWDSPISGAVDTTDMPKTIDPGQFERPASLAASEKDSSPVQSPVLAQPEIKPAAGILKRSETQPSFRPLNPIAAQTVRSVVPELPESMPAATTIEPNKTQPALSSPFEQGPEDTVHSLPKQEQTDLTAPPSPSASELILQSVKLAPEPVAEMSAKPAGNSPLATASPAQPPSPDSVFVEAVVQRVLDKMRPQVVDIITKEFLRPIVQALVHREIEKD